MRVCRESSRNFRNPRRGRVPSACRGEMGVFFFGFRARSASRDIHNGPTSWSVGRFSAKACERQNQYWAGGAPCRRCPEPPLLTSPALPRRYYITILHFNIEPCGALQWGDDAGTDPAAKNAKPRPNADTPPPLRYVLAPGLGAPDVEIEKETRHDCGHLRPPSDVAPDASPRATTIFVAADNGGFSCLSHVCQP